MSCANKVDVEAAEEVVRKLSASVEKKGLDVYPFKVGWYNAMVEKPYHFPLHEDTLAVLVISAPSMFEKLFLPFAMGEQFVTGKVDPLDECIREEMNRVASLFSRYKVEFIQDSELMPSRRPKVLVQTAAHVAGAAYYYQRKDVNTPQPWSEDCRVFGASVHPRYGGWFAMRGVLIFHGLLAPSLVQQAPVDCVSSQEKRIELLEKFNTTWQDFRYRDVMDSDVVERYSERQKMYFATEPWDRFELIQKWKLHEELS